MNTVMAANGPSTRLVGWKAIGQYLRCTERTARRWEVDRAMPVHRVPGGGRSLVWADPEELSAWLSALPSDIQAEVSNEGEFSASLPPSAPTPESELVEPASGTAVAPPSRSKQQGLVLAIAGLLIVLALIGVIILRSTVHPSLPVAERAYAGNPAAREIFVAARFELATRTAESLAAAERDFRRVIDLEPRQAAAWSGLADTYLLQRQFGPIGDEVAYPKAAEAAQKAIALDPKLADAWLDQAFVAFWWRNDAAAAFQDFETALRLDPQSAKAFHWYGTALLAHGDFDKSLQMVARARALEPDSRAIVASEGLMRFIAGQRTEGLATLERLVSIDPSFVSGHTYLSRAYLTLGREEDFLREATTAAELRGNVDDLERLKLARERYRVGGGPAMLAQLAASEQTAFKRGAGSAMMVALYLALAQDEDGMLEWLAIAEANHDHNLPRLRSDPEFDQYRKDPRFAAFVQRQP